MEKPDKRIIPLIVLVLLASLVWVVTPKSSQYFFHVELALYVLTIVYGLAVAWLSTALQYSVMKPSISKAQEPQKFMLEVWLGGYACAAFGAWFLYGLFK